MNAKTMFALMCVAATLALGADKNGHWEVVER